MLDESYERGIGLVRKGQHMDLDVIGTRLDWFAMDILKRKELIMLNPCSGS